MTGHEIRYEILLFTQLPINIVKNILKLIKRVDTGLTHHIRHVFSRMFRCHLQLTAYVKLA